MKKSYTKLIAVLAALLVSVSLFSQEYGNVLTESFENGIPAEWSQEKVSGSIDWTVESGELTRPSNAFDGVKRVAFRNTTGVTTRAKTRLVSPVMDISKLYQPILVFAHAQDKWTEDFDTLKIFYRTAPEKEWVELEVFDKYLAKWQIDTVRLIAASTTYQIAFEATDNLGRGVVIDNIQVRSTPNCLAPYDLSVFNISNDSVTVTWWAAYDAMSISLKVSSVALTPEQLADNTFKADVFDQDLVGKWEQTIKNLTQGTTYYYYVRSNCAEEVSEWTSSSFKTANVLQLPYVQGFESKETPGYVTYPMGWYCAASASTSKPYVNSGNTGDKYYTSNDGTYVLCFNGVNDVAGDAPISGGSYAYAVMPEINLPSLKPLQLSFWSIRYYPAVSERSSIIVGVMTDPTMKASFVPVDTINTDLIREYVEYSVSFENYEGDGRFIAFMSDFQESNVFVIDNIKVNYRAEVQKVTFDFGIPSATSVKLDFDQEYEKYEVAVVNNKVDSLQQLETSIDVLRYEIVNHRVVDKLQPTTEYYVYARGVKGTAKGEWSNPRRVRMPGKALKTPYIIDFEVNKDDISSFYYYQQGIYINTSAMMDFDAIVITDHHVTPLTTNSYGDKQRTPYELMIQSSIADDSYMTAVFSEMIDPKKTRVSFYATTHYIDYGATAYVGTMTDATDQSTFVAFDTITLKYEDKYEAFAYELDKYENVGPFFAISIDKAHYTEERTNQIYLDDVLYEELSECRYPTNITYQTIDPADPSKGSISWDANGVSSWNVRIAKVEYPLDSIEANAKSCQYVYETTVNTNKIDLSELQFPGVKYYCWIQPVCGEKVEGWTFPTKLITDCYVVQPLPFFEDFNKPHYNTGSYEIDFPVPCFFTNRVKKYTQFYPILTDGQSATKTEIDGEEIGKSLYLQRTNNTNYQNTYVALPKMAAPVKELQLTLKAYVVDAKYHFNVGVVEDPLDSANIEVVTTIKPKVIREFVEYNISFENYTGKGEYITISSAGSDKNAYIYIDDIYVDYASSCPHTGELELKDVTNSSVTLGWANPSATAWNVMITTERLTNQQLLNIATNGVVTNDTIVKIEKVTTHPATISGLADNTPYYAYVQSVCADTLVGSWSNPLPFRTSCVVLTVGELGVENFDIYGTGSDKYPPCFVVGNKSNPTSSTYYPQCASTYKYSGGASLKFNTTPTYNGAYVITSRLDISDITMLRVKFWGSATSSYASSKYAHSLVVGVVTDPSDIATFVPIDTLNFGPEGRPYEVCLDSYKYDYNGQKGKYVMFLSEFDKNNTVFIDDLEFDTIPTCLPKFKITNIQHNAIDVKFTNASSAYQLKYAKSLCEKAELDKDSLPVVNLTAGDSLTIKDLTANTTYYLYARTMCGSDYSDWSVVEVVTTACVELLSLPFFDNFEDQIFTFGVPTCWNAHTITNSSSIYPSPSSSGYNSSERSAYLYATSSGQPYLVSQEVDVANMNKCQVGFYAKPNAAKKDRSIIVGVVSSLDSIKETFVAIDTIIMNHTSAIYEQQLVSLESYVGDGKYVAFTTNYMLNEKANGGVYIDDISIELIPNCDRPMDFEIVNVADNYVEFSYVHESATKFAVKYGAPDFDPTIDGTEVVVESNVVKVTGLETQTTYDFYVSAICSDMDKSSWAYAGQYTTTGAVVSTFPYSCNFENSEENAKWQFAQEEQPNQWYIGADTAFVVSDSLNNGDKAMYISKDGGLSAQYRSAEDENGNSATSYSWAYRAFKLEPGVYSISYDWTCFGEGTSDYIRAGFLPTTSKFAAGTNKVYAKDGSSVSMTYTASTQPKGWIELCDKNEKGYFLLNGVDTTLTLAQQWKSKSHLEIIEIDQAGVYSLVFYWKNDASKGDYANKRSAVIDNVWVNKESCDMPVKLGLNDLNINSVDVYWESIFEPAEQYEYKITTYVDKTTSADTIPVGGYEVVARGIVDTTRAIVNELAAATDYYCYVRSICGINDTSLWSEVLEFTTPCIPHAIDSVYNFDAEDGYYLPPYETGTTENTDYKVPNCFLSDHELEFNATNDDFFPYLIKNTKNKTYSRSGEYALKFYRNNSTNKSGGTLIFPLIEGNLEELQLNFWMRCIEHTPSTGKIGTTGIGSTYDCNITVGTMTNPYDLSTFVPIGTYVYPYDKTKLTSQTRIADDDTGNDFWVEVSVPLASATGKYIAIRNEALDGAKSYNLVYIDDISITSLSCITPTTFEFKSITSSSVEINAEVSDAEKFVIQFSTDEDFESIVRVDTVTTIPTIITGLDSGTEYFVKMQSICSAEEKSKWSIPVSFVTLSTLPYDQHFSMASYRPHQWSQASAPTLAKYLDGTTPTFTMSTSTTSSGWVSTSALFDKGMFSTNHLEVLVNATNKYWLFSPTFEMPKSGNMHLVFDLALTAQDSNLPLTEEDKTKDDDRFVVLVSEDGGATWNNQNMTIWGHDSICDYRFFDIPNTGRQYSIDLSKYAGKEIKIAFYAESTKSSGGIKQHLHLDNVHLNLYKENPQQVPLCQTEDCFVSPFSITSDNLYVGENEFTNLELKSTTEDILHKLKVVVTPMVEFNINDFICKGDVYAKHNFSELTEGGVYKQKIRSANGCDSVVTLNLSIVEPVTVMTFDTICQGNTVEWRGKEYGKTGRYVDTLVSAVTKCDSIVVLMLKVNDAIREEMNVNVCFGDSYQLGNQTIRTSGTYSEMFETATGCDSLVTVNVTVLPNFRKEIHAVIEKGETYSGNGFEGLSVAGTYELPLKSVDGCDSTIILHLAVVEDVSVIIDVNICYGENYVFGNDTITITGQYIKTFKTADGADSTVVLNATVLPDLRQTIEAVICAGETYTEYGFNVDTEGTHTLPLTSVDGCDSTITLNLMVLGGDTIHEEKTISTADLPFEYHGLYYDESTQPGVYVDTIVVEKEGCEEVIIFTLTVNLADALDDVSMTDLILVPNPVSVNNTLYLNAEFTDTERRGLYVEVFNAIGQCVYVQTPTSYPIRIEGLSERGVYIVRVVTGEGTSYQGKVIVK